MGSEGWGAYLASREKRQHDDENHGAAGESSMSLWWCLESRWPCRGWDARWWLGVPDELVACP